MNVAVCHVGHHALDCIATPERTVYKHLALLLHGLSAVTAAIRTDIQQIDR